MQTTVNRLEMKPYQNFCFIIFVCSRIINPDKAEKRLNKNGVAIEAAAFLLQFNFLVN